VRSIAETEFAVEVLVHKRVDDWDRAEKLRRFISVYER
jgi:hypothetical protein